MRFDQRAKNLYTPDNGHEVDPDCPVPGRIVPLAITACATDTRIVDENMHFAKAFDRGVGCGLQLVLKGHIRDHAVDVSIRLLQVA